MGEKTFGYKEVKENGDIIEITIWKVPESEKQPEGISYTMAYIRNGERIIGYDNFEGHIFESSSHHKRIKDRLFPYEFVDEWKAIEDFYNDVEKAKQRGLI